MSLQTGSVRGSRAMFEAVPTQIRRDGPMDQNAELPDFPRHRPEGMHDYVVTLREEVLAPEGLPAGRLRVRALDRINESFRQELMRRLRVKGLETEVAGIGPALGIAAMVTLTCTPQVSDFLRGMTEVKDVVLDDHTMGLVR